MKLPNAERAVVDLAKLRDYSLNPAHPEGKHKARVFATMIGYTADDAEKLREIILAAVLQQEAAEGIREAYAFVALRSDQMMPLYHRKRDAA